MPESPREGEPSPTRPYVGALGGYPPLGDQLTPEPAPKKRSSWRWLAPLIVALVIIVVGAVIAIAYLTAQHH